MITDNQMQGALDAFFTRHGDATRVALLTLIRALMCELNVQDADSYDQVEGFLRAQVAQGKIAWIKGRAGGLTRKPNCMHGIDRITCVPCTTPQVAPRLTVDDYMGYPEPAAKEAVNDHICPGCGNDRVSKSEKTCWKCGGNLHADR